MIEFWPAVGMVHPLPDRVRTTQATAQRAAPGTPPGTAQSSLAGLAGMPGLAGQETVSATRVLERAERAVAAASRATPRGVRATLWIACVGALAYNSWPLAFLVNRSLAGGALASSFEAHSEPYAWLFILLDCIAGSCTAVVCVRELRPRSWLPRSSLAVVLALLAYGMFGMATGIDAMVPLSCGSASAEACASQIWPLTPDDLLTGTAIFALFVAAVIVIVQMTRKPLVFPSYLPVAATVALIGWSGLGLVVLLWSTSAVIAATAQYAFLTLTSVLAFIVPLVATYLRSDAGTGAGAGAGIGTGTGAVTEIGAGAGADYVGSS